MGAQITNKAGTSTFPDAVSIIMWGMSG